MRTRTISLWLALFCALALSALAASPIPLEDFFKGYAFDEIKISPDGSKVAALSKWKDHLNLYVIDLKTKKPQQITGIETMNVSNVVWVGNTRLVYTAVEDGFWAGGLFAIDADGKNHRTLAKSAKQQASEGQRIFRTTQFLDHYGTSTDEILVTSNERNEAEPDVYRMNVRTGAKKRVATNPGHVESAVADHAGAVRIARGEFGMERFLMYRDTAEGDWREVKRWKFTEGDIIPLAFDEQNKLVYVSSSIGRDTAEIALYDPVANKIVQTLCSDPTYDVTHVLLARATGRRIGYAYSAEKQKYVMDDPQFQKLQKLLDEALPDTLNEPYSTSDDLTWVVVLAHSDRDPGTFYLLNTRELGLEKLVSRAPWIDVKQMAAMRPIQYTARDGLPIHGYLTLPAGVEPRNLPLIVNPHGGPWVRDEWGFNREVQFLASRGYAVLQMNFRGSTGYGTRHNQAGFNQWGLAMQDDITDAVKWSIDQGIADPKRVAIYGASYGGYATMAGLAFTPELYRCGINYVGVTDIALLLKTIPKGWEAVRAQMEAMTGNAKKDRERLDATSPLKGADKIRVPVFLAYGELDDRIDMKHATRLVAKLRDNNVKVELMTRDNEGHGYHRFKNVIAFYGKMEEFLSANMK